MKHSANKALAAALLLTALVCLLAACGGQAGSQVAGARQQVIYGYLLEVNDQARTVTVDPVELIAGSDLQRMARLGLGTEVPAGGRSRVYNARRDYVMYALDKEADFDFGGRADNNGADSSSASMSEGSDQGRSLGAANLTGNGPQGTSAFDQPGNSVSGNTTVGDGTATIPDGSDGSPAPILGEGYGYLGVEGGLFDRISSGYDRINAYLARYGDLLCRLTVEDGAVTKIAVCTKDNL